MRIFYLAWKGASMNRSLRMLSFALAAVALAAALLPAPVAAQTAGPYSFYAVTPCRVVDTRCPAGPASGGCPALDTPNGTPALVGNGTPRNFKMRGNCGVPAG